MISSIVRQDETTSVFNNSAANSQTKPIAEMSQVEKVDLATQIANGAIDASEITRLCADPNFITEFLNDEEVQPIVLTAVLQSKEISDDLIQALKNPACKLSMKSDKQATVMLDVFHWLSSLREKPEMAFTIKFFKNASSQREIMNAIGMESIKDACDRGMIDDKDVRYSLLFLYEEARADILEQQSAVLRKELNLLEESIKFQQTQLLEMNPMDPSDSKITALKNQLETDKTARDLKAKELDEVTNSVFNIACKIMDLNRGT